MILKAPTLFLCCDQWEWTSVYNQLKTEPWGWVGTNRSPKEWCTTDDISTVLFWQDPPRISRRKVAAQRPLDFSLTNYHLTDGYPHVFPWLISFFQRVTAMLLTETTFCHTFFPASCNVCSMAIPEICVQTQGSNYWQLIHCATTRTQGLVPKY